MLPWLAFLPMWESTSTARLAATHSLNSSFQQADTVSSLTGGEAAFEARTRTDGADYGAQLSGAYARALTASFGEGGGGPPSDNGSAHTALRAAWQLGPLSSLSLDSSAMLASRFGVRAIDPIALRDPFLRDRTLYSFGQNATLSFATSPRGSVQVGGGYGQTGAVAADVPEAQGIDTHAGTGRLGYSYALTRRTQLLPEARYVYTHFYNALLDVNLNRGPADVHAGTGLLGASHALTRTIAIDGAGGVTVASPPPILGSEDLVVSPEARLGARYVTSRYKVAGSYSYAYTSLGPRVGFGNAHSALGELSTKPLGGAKFRDFVVKGIGRFTYGSAPVAANPPLNLPPGTPPPEGVVTTLGTAVGAQIEYPIIRGIAMLAGVDLEYLRARFDPTPPVPLDSTSLRTLWTVGLVGVFSTDPANTVRRDPDEEDEPRGLPPVDDRRADVDRDALEAGRDRIGYGYRGAGSRETLEPEAEPVAVPAPPPAPEPTRPLGEPDSAAPGEGSPDEPASTPPSTPPTPAPPPSSTDGPGASADEVQDRSGRAEAPSEEDGRGATGGEGALDPYEDEPEPPSLARAKAEP